MKIRRLAAHPGLLAALTTAGLSLGAGIPAARAQEFGLGALLNPEGSRLFPQLLVLPRHPGKPDLRWRTFTWEFVDVAAPRASRFRLYFYPENRWTATYAVPQLRAQIEELSTKFGYAPTRPFSYLLFASQRDFQQANIFNISEGVEGITSTTEATMAIPYWGEAETFRHISTHEMTHQFQVQKMMDLGEGGQGGAFEVAPLWFVEGMAEYYSLGGVDPESRAFIRDLLIYPDPGKDYTMPHLFDDGPLSFVTVYKVGQAKIDFFETEFGKGTVQRLLATMAKPDRSDRAPEAAPLVARLLGTKPDELEKKWQAYLNKNYRSEADALAQPLEAYEPLDFVGENLDSFAFSGSGDLLATREIDPVTGVASIQLYDRKDHDRKIEVIHDHQGDALSLYFLQGPGMALSEHFIAYVAASVSGPKLEIRKISRDRDGRISLSGSLTLLMSSFSIAQAGAPAISADERQLAFVGVDGKGWQNVYLFPLKIDGDHDLDVGEIRQLTDTYYSWRGLSWCKEGILAASDRTRDTRYNLFLLDPRTGSIRRLSHSTADQLAPNGGPDKIVFQSWQSRTSQIHLLVGGKETRLTAAKTGLVSPQINGGRLYALGFRGGRYHLYHVPESKLLDLAVPTAPAASPADDEPWIARPEAIAEPDIHRYHPFVTSGLRVDFISGFFATGGVGGLFAAVSDLMRNYSIYGEFSSFGQLRYTNADVFFTSNVGRTKWTVGAYRLLQARLDNIFSPQDSLVRTYLASEYGALGALQYPLGAFTFVDGELRVSGIKRTDFSDAGLAPLWETMNPGTELSLTPVFRVGYDSILYEAFTGPLQGFGVMTELATNFFPNRGGMAQRARLDVAKYFPLSSRTTLALQGIGGVSWGDKFNDPFLVSSDDILRAYPFQDDRLYGNYLLAAKGELRFPIGSLFKFDPLRGLVGYDVGSIVLNSHNLKDGLTSSWSAGLAFNIPPISITLLDAFPLREAPGPRDASVFHFSLRYLYL